MIFGKKTTVSSFAEMDNHLPQYFSALSDQRRYQMVKLLLKRNDLSVSQIAKVFRTSISAASQQLKYLELSGIIKRVRQGQRIQYEIKEDDLLVKDLLKLITG